MTAPKRRSWTSELLSLKTWHLEQAHSEEVVSSAIPGRLVRAERASVHHLAVAEIDRRLER